MQQTLKSTLLVLSTGYIFVYYSEHLFWARFRPDNSLIDFMMTWIVYSLMAFVFLTIVTHFKINDIWRLFLAGAAFGWLGEGLVVQTAYEQLPLSISFTGLAWHALITVWVGWYAVRRSFFSPAPFAALKLAAIIGLGYGLWAVSWWLEPDGGVASLPEFAAFSLVSTLLLILAYLLANWSASEPFNPNRWVILFVLGLFLLYFVFVTVPASPQAALFLPFLIGLVYWGLRRVPSPAGDTSLVDILQGPLVLWKPLSLLVLPAIAISFYALALTLNFHWRTNWLLYLITTPLGFILFIISLYRARRASHEGLKITDIRT